MSSCEVSTVESDQEHDKQPVIDEPSEQKQSISVDLNKNHVEVVDDHEDDNLTASLSSISINTCEETSQVSSPELKVTATNEAPSVSPTLLAGIKRRSRKSRKRKESRQNWCQLAESFCFGPLENAAFFRVFNEYTKRRRRLSYTEFFEDNDKKMDPMTVSVSDLFLHYGNLQRNDELQRICL